MTQAYNHTQNSLIFALCQTKYSIPVALRCLKIKKQLNTFMYLKRCCCIFRLFYVSETSKVITMTSFYVNQKIFQQSLVSRSLMSQLVFTQNQLYLLMLCFDHLLYIVFGVFLNSVFR